MITWLVEDVASAVTRLTSAGVKFLDPPNIHDQGSAFPCGPDGQLLEVKKLQPVSGSNSLSVHHGD
eukprot:COSAG02_NODE_35_length_49339_cov_20.375102_29_plen_66_part_00